jgi:hypothetical protein
MSVRISPTMHAAVTELWRDGARHVFGASAGASERECDLAGCALQACCL